MLLDEQIKHGEGIMVFLRHGQGKGHKDRYAMLPPVLLERLRTWWRVRLASLRVAD